jgi:hypothetical protein
MMVASAQSNDWKKISWLMGSWERTQMKPGRAGVEMWTKVSDTEWSGRGISLKGMDTSFVEKLKIIEESNQLYYVSDVPENKKPIYFKITEATTHSLVCENPEHDFPKKIAYYLEGGNLKATISGDGKSIDYFFIRKD